ncbi:hypothetical protein SKAU_G00379880 [Synaphobranchus kaupii]|uniref:Ig-like domain-containing protein n=1 Tax=Synaphobranchus kaupii TaxID=118154 RepID=A0A9Q1EDF9_SYNKA|nr:hypothetical protein SKAU_G00379880 [Synaphobranchus kaupii]
MQQPTLSLSSSYSALLPGDEVRFRCASPADVCAPVEVRFYKLGSGSPLVGTSESVGSGVELAVNNVDAKHQGSYTCQYTVQGIVLPRSPPSNSIAIYIVDLLPPRMFLSSPAEGVTWGPQGPELTRGHSFTITCSTQPQYPGGSFHLYFMGSKVTESQAAVNHSASFLFSSAEHSLQGNYSCVYETTVSTRSFNSPASTLLHLTVTGKELQVRL